MVEHKLRQINNFQSPLGGAENLRDPTDQSAVTEPMTEIVFFDVAWCIAETTADQVIGMSHVVHQDCKHDGSGREGKDPVQKDRDPLISSRVRPGGNAM
jgi:hypothetical protein